MLESVGILFKIGEKYEENNEEFAENFHILINK